MSFSRYKEPPPVVHLVEDRSTTVSPWGLGNTKLGPGIYTYSKLPGKIGGSCPGATGECELICYAKRAQRNPLLHQLWTANTERGDVLPPLPADAKIVRMHVSGDFDTQAYVAAWYGMADRHPQVTFYGYTRSWRVGILRYELDAFGRLPNVKLWASIDKEMKYLPTSDWSRAWLDDDPRIEKITDKSYKTFDGKIAIICPEETGLLPNCAACKFCFVTRSRDLVFVRH